MPNGEGYGCHKGRVMGAKWGGLWVEMGGGLRVGKGEG